MPLSLTNPALQYDQPPQTDPTSGLQYNIPALLKFFKNPGARARQFAEDASQAVQPSTSTVEGQIGEPIVTPPSVTQQDAAGIIGPRRPDIVDPGSVTPGQDQTTVGMQGPAIPMLPRFLRPKFSETLTTADGLPAPINLAQTKFGKLLAVIKAATEGGLAGSQAGTFGGGYEAAKAEPYQDLSRNLGAENATLQNQQQRANIAMLPWQRAQQIQAIQKGQYITPSRGGVFDVRTGKFVPGTEPPDPNQTPDQRVLDAQTRIAQGIGTDADRATVTAFERVQQTKQDVKPDTGAQADIEYQNILKKEALKQPLSPEERATKRAYEQRKTLGPRTTFNLQQGQPDDIEAAAQALVNPRNLTALKEISSWRGDQRLKIFARARQIDPTFDPGLVGERVKFLQSYEDPKGRAGINRQAINNILQHAGDLADINNEYRRTEVQVINTGMNAIARQFGVATYIRYAATNEVLKDELSLYFAGGYAPPVDQQKVWSKIQSDQATPAQTEAFAKEVVHLGLRRASTFNSQFKKVMGYDDPDMITPDAAGAAENLGMGDEVSRFHSGGGYGSYGQQPAEQRSAPKGGKYPAGFSPL